MAKTAKIEDRPAEMEQPKQAPAVEQTAASAASAQSVAAAQTQPPPTAEETAVTIPKIMAAIQRHLPNMDLAQRRDIVKLVGEWQQPKPSDGPVYQPGHLYEFQVTWPRAVIDGVEKTSITIVAPNSIDAWALFCDQIKKYPSPKSGEVKLLGEVASEL